MYNVIISDQANEDIDCQLEYILRQFNNQQAIDAIITDIDETLGYIEDNPYVFSDYDSNCIACIYVLWNPDVYKKPLSL